MYFTELQWKYFTFYHPKSLKYIVYFTFCETSHIFHLYLDFIKCVVETEASYAYVVSNMFKIF